jgi:hypothetical protein
MKNTFPVFILVLLLGSCAVGKNYNPSKKFSPQQLQDDYHLFRNILEESHPSLYWYTPKDSIDHYFEIGESKLKDSLPEYKFRYVLSYVLSKIKCGHTSVRASKAATAYSERTRSFALPIGVKIWDDTVVVTNNLNRTDSTITHGVILKAIEGRPVKMIIDSFFQHLSGDGYNKTHKYQSLSNPGVFRNMYGSIYGLKSKMQVQYEDTLGMLRSASLSVYNPSIDTPRTQQPPRELPSKKERKKRILLSNRSLRIDTILHTAFLDVNSFTKNNKLRSFFRRSFRQIRKEQIPNLVVDMRGNGGGSVVLSNLLTKYLADKPFKIADSLYAVKRKSSYGEYQQNYFWNRLFFVFMTHKKTDGHYHFSYFENRYFKPKKKNHYSGTTYIMTGGNTFSAATLFTHALKQQQDVIVIGEETGGGAYGNTAWLIPDVTLPNTKVRFRLPLLRLVINKTEERGRGIIPEIEVKPTVESIRRNADFKMERVVELIKAGNQ